MPIRGSADSLGVLGTLFICEVGLAGHRAALFRTLDALCLPVLVFDQQGHALHDTAALRDLLQADTQRGLLRREIRHAMQHVRRTMHAANGSGSEAPLVASVTTQQARYCLRAAAYQSPAVHSLILVAVEKRSPTLDSDSELRARFDLTRAEINVARLIARGKTNAEIAEQLSISPHTARRHTEKILLKLNVRTRTEIVSRLLS